MLKAFFAAMLFFMSFSAAHAATVVQKITYDIFAGTFTGQSLVFEFSYPTLPPGGFIFTYNPDFSASVSIADAFSASPASSQIIFSGSGDILQPEFYASFVFDPAANSLNLRNAELFVSPAGLFVDGAPDLEIIRCRQNATCSKTTTVVPVPPGILLLLTGLLLTGATPLLWRHRRRRIR